MIAYNSVEEIISEAQSRKIKISELVISDQAKALEISEEAIISKMLRSYQVMKESIESGIHAEELSTSGLSGLDARKMNRYQLNADTLTGETLSRALTYALAVAETNACMGRIVAAPTAGSCGIVPAALVAIQEKLKLSDKEVVKGLFTASAIGMVIARIATVSGAQGGCQAECGSASAMATGALIELLGGKPDQIGHGCALALKAVLGLVCDPVAGLVEVPCVKRNAMGVAQAFTATDMAMAGIESIIPIDEVILAMKSIGDELPQSLKETSEGGLAVTKTAKAIELRLL